MNLRRIPQASFVRDWRIKTLVPVIIINLVAFAGLYGLMYHFAVSNLIGTQKVAGSVLLDELEFTFPDMMRDHSGTRLRTRIEREAAVHNLVDLNLFDNEARPVLTLDGVVTPSLRAAVADTLRDDGDATQWIVAPGDRTLLVGIRPLANKEACRGCHESTMTRLGALQMSIDLTSPLAAARKRVGSRFALAGGAWIALLGIMFYAGGIIIGRPLKAIRQSLPAGGAESQDLDALAQRVHETIWTTIERQRERDDDVTRQLARAQQLAALGELAAGLTHEIKNPLAGVIAALEVVRDEHAGHAELFDQMTGELRRVTTTLDSLLRLARPQPPQRTEVDVGRIVRDLTSIYALRFSRHGVELNVQTAESLPLLSLDAALISQLVVNLLTNSFQATPRGGSVRVFVTPFPQRDGVLLVVDDDGCGIGAEHLDRIFDPFFTTKEDGTGLGLAICRQIVTQHGGSISIESQPGRGTRVIVLLPDTRTHAMEEHHGLTAAG